MDLKDVLIFSLKYTIAGVIKELDKGCVAPAPPKIKAFLVGACRLLGQLDPDPIEDKTYQGEDGI